MRMTDTPETPAAGADAAAAAPPPTAEQVFRDYAPRIYQIARRLLGNDAERPTDRRRHHRRTHGTRTS